MAKTNRSNAARGARTGRRPFIGYDEIRDRAPQPAESRNANTHSIKLQREKPHFLACDWIIRRFGGLHRGVSQAPELRLGILVN